MNKKRSPMNLFYNKEVCKKYGAKFFTLYLRNSIIKNIMEERVVKITKEKAIEYYNSGNEVLKELALSAFKEGELTPTSEWEKYCENRAIPGGVVWINENSNISIRRSNTMTWSSRYHKNLYLNEREAKAALALNQLRLIRKSKLTNIDYSYWPSIYQIKYCTKFNRFEITSDPYSVYGIWNFPSKQMAQEFLDNNTALFEQLKPYYTE